MVLAENLNKKKTILASNFFFHTHVNTYNRAAQLIEFLIAITIMDATIT